MQLLNTKKWWEDRGRRRAGEFQRVSKDAPLLGRWDPHDAPKNVDSENHLHFGRQL